MADDQVEMMPAPQARGGRARADALSAEERSSIARSAALARWYAAMPRATHEGELAIGDLQLQCAVLDGGRRVLSERGVLRALGIHYSGPTYRRGVMDDGDDGAVRLPMFVAHSVLRPFIDNELMALLTQPIEYRPLQGGRPGRGLDATLVPKVCELWLKARDAGKLQRRQLGIAARADALVRGLARTGIIALVDEATGYQEVRDRLALQAILDAYLKREFAAWAKRFPDEFYYEIFRLRRWTWDDVRAGKGKQGPRVIGKYTNDVVYSRLAPGVLEELKRINPPNDSGRRRAKHHQFFTEDVGHPALAQHVSNVLTLMKASDGWDDFLRLLNRALPRKTSLKDLPLFSQADVAVV